MIPVVLILSVYCLLFLSCSPQVKVKRAAQFLRSGDKVKVSIQFRGREIDFKQLGVDLFQRFSTDLTELCSVEAKQTNGKLMIMTLAPTTKKTDVVKQREMMTKEGKKKGDERVRGKDRSVDRPTGLSNYLYLSIKRNRTLDPIPPLQATKLTIKMTTTRRIMTRSRRASPPRTINSSPRLVPLSLQTAASSSTIPTVLVLVRLL